MENWLARIAPDGASWFTHTAEGPDDMAAHLRSLVSGTSLGLPVTAGRCALGTWQGIYLWEHRTAGHHRKLVVTVHGD
jgi:secondary thiamine-phosphate synthase enzyme